MSKAAKMDFTAARKVMVDSQVRVNDVTDRHIHAAMPYHEAKKVSAILDTDAKKLRRLNPNLGYAEALTHALINRVTAPSADSSPTTRRVTKPAAPQHHPPETCDRIRPSSRRKPQDDAV